MILWQSISLAHQLDIRALLFLHQLHPHPPFPIPLPPPHHSDTQQQQQQATAGGSYKKTYVIFHHDPRPRISRLKVHDPHVANMRVKRL